MGFMEKLWSLTALQKAILFLPLSGSTPKVFLSSNDTDYGVIWKCIVHLLYNVHFVSIAAVADCREAEKVMEAG